MLADRHNQLMRTELQLQELSGPFKGAARLEGPLPGAPGAPGAPIAPGRMGRGRPLRPFQEGRSQAKYQG